MELQQRLQQSKIFKSDQSAEYYPARVLVGKIGRKSFLPKHDPKGDLIFAGGVSAADIAGAHGVTVPPDRTQLGANGQYKQEYTTGNLVSISHLYLPQGKVVILILY